MAEKENSCIIFPDHPDYCDWLLSCKRIAGCLSVVGCLFTVFIIWLFHKYTEFSQRMIIHLSIGTLIQAVIYLMVDIVSEATPLCIIQGALMQFVAWVILLWILAIILNLLMHVIGSRTLEKHEKIVSVFCWFVPVLISALPFIDNAYAPAGAWCWLKNTWGWRFGSWYIWSISSCVFIFISIVFITYKLRTNSESVVGTTDSGFTRGHLSIRDAVRTLRVYPIAYFLVILFPTINRIQNVLHGSHGHDAYIFELLLLHSLTDPLDGAVITLAFVMDRRTRHFLNWKAIREAWKRKFESKEQIHEFKLRSKLSVSDFVIATRVSIASVEYSSEVSQNGKEPKKREKNDDTMETIREIENSYEVRIKTQNKRRVSYSHEIEVHVDGNNKNNPERVSIKENINQCKSEGNQSSRISSVSYSQAVEVHANGNNKNAPERIKENINEGKSKGNKKNKTSCVSYSQAVEVQADGNNENVRERVSVKENINECKSEGNQSDSTSSASYSQAVEVHADDKYKTNQERESIKEDINEYKSERNQRDGAT